jgi:hypothetical protein
MLWRGTTRYTHGESGENQMSNRPATAAQYVDLVKQAIFELEDTVEALGFDIDEIDGIPGYLPVLLKELRALRATMGDGSYRFDRHDLPMMRIVRQNSDKELPCIRLLYQINETHKLGLDVPQD